MTPEWSVGISVLLVLVNVGLVGLNLKLYTEVQKLRVLRGEER